MRRTTSRDNRDAMSILTVSDSDGAVLPEPQTNPESYIFVSYGRFLIDNDQQARFLSTRSWHFSSAALPLLILFLPQTRFRHRQASIAVMAYVCQFSCRPTF